jgi:Zn-finger nucleic acid-binding protein
MDLMCPRDGKPLAAGTEHGIEVDSCLACGGAWYDDDELAALESTVGDEEQRRGTIDYAKRASTLACPVCEAPMHAFNYRAYNLELDACAEGHGFWLDAGEAVRVRDIMKERVQGLRRSAGAERSWHRAKSGGSGVVEQLKDLFRRR